MSEYRFHLQKYRPGSKITCPKCGRKACFTQYIDGEGQISFPDNVGKCDHINSCGYHYTPKEYFNDTPTVRETLTGKDGNGNITSTVIKPAGKPSPKPQPQISYLPYAWVKQSMQRFDINPLYRYLTTVAGREKTDWLFNLYKIGTSKMWHGATVFWQIDVKGNVRVGKIMGYDAVTGHRIKEPFNQVSWVHSVRKIPDFHMKQCLFGEHLLADASSSARTVAIVESEKTALVETHCSFPIWFGSPPEVRTAVSTTKPCRCCEGVMSFSFQTLRQRMNGNAKPECFNPFVNLPHVPTY